MNIDRGLFRISLVVVVLGAVITAVLLALLSAAPGSKTESMIYAAVITYATLGWTLFDRVAPKYPKRKKMAQGWELLMILTTIVFEFATIAWAYEHVAADATKGLVVLLAVVPLVGALLVVGLFYLMAKTVGFVFSGFSSK